MIKEFKDVKWGLKELGWLIKWWFIELNDWINKSLLLLLKSINFWAYLTDKGWVTERENSGNLWDELNISLINFIDSSIIMESSLPLLIIDNDFSNHCFPNCRTQSNEETCSFNQIEQSFKPNLRSKLKRDCINETNLTFNWMCKLVSELESFRSALNLNKDIAIDELVSLISFK